MIGRAYSAAIERRKNKKQGAGTDNFYVETVGPMLRKSKIDRWIDDARASRPGTSLALATLVKVHGLATDLFYGISGLEKRALASKYLHFHVPNHDLCVGRFSLDLLPRHVDNLLLRVNER